MNYFIRTFGKVYEVGYSGRQYVNVVRSYEITLRLRARFQLVCSGNLLDIIKFILVIGLIIRPRPFVITTRVPSRRLDT